MEPIDYFKYKLPKWYNAWNGKLTDFSHRAIAGYEHFISVYQDKKMVVLISNGTKEKLQCYYDNRTETAKAPLLCLSQAGRWYANGFTSAYNFCEQYTAKHADENFDFAPYVKRLEEENDKDVQLQVTISRDYVINIGRIEGARFFIEEHGISQDERNEQDKDVALTQDDAQYSNIIHGLALAKNLRPARNNQRIIDKIEEIINSCKSKSIVGYCIICIKELGLTDSSDDVLKAAFRSDFFPDVEKRVFDTSINRILRSYRQKDTYSGTDKGERWGTKRETICQDVYKKLRIAISMN